MTMRNNKELSPRTTGRNHQCIESPFLRRIGFAIQASNGLKYRKSWSINLLPRNYGRSMKWKASGGEPDVVALDKYTGDYIFFDCSAESPKGRRSICYDREALEARKENKPQNNALDMGCSYGH